MFEKLLEKIAAALDKHKIPYMVIGGQAVLLYGEPRLTRDIDITLALSGENLDRLLGAIGELHLKILPDHVESFVKKTMVCPALEPTTGIRVDFIFSHTPYERTAIKRAKKVRLLGKEVCFSSLEDLIIHKIFSGRPRDLEDVKMLILKNPKYDVRYVQKWLKEFDLLSEDKKYSSILNQMIKDLKVK